jgi:hypothetical protein
MQGYLSRVIMRKGRATWREFIRGWTSLTNKRRIKSREINEAWDTHAILVPM